MNELLTALLYVTSPVPLAFLVLGVVSGIVFGAIPGLSGGMLIALCIPLTYAMDSKLALTMFIAMYVASVAGGLISATLLRMPGTPSSVMTTFDGFPMARAGKAGRALGLGIGASFVGGMLAGVVLVLLAPPLSRWAVAFGPWEYFTMVLMALVLIASLSQGSMVKGLVSGILGMIVAMPGISEADGNLRLTFGFHQLDAGFDLVPVLLGAFVISQVIRDVVEMDRPREALKVGASSVMLSLPDFARHGVNMVRSSVIGTWIGILPGVGASVSSMIAYATAKSLSRAPERFGTGAEEGVVASESANNANVGGALIPIVAMGIPGSPICAILIGALILHNVQPGPMLFITHRDLTWAIIAAYLVANVLMFVIMLGTARWMARLITVNRAYLLPAIVFFCIVGAYAVSNRMFDVWALLGFGVLGYFMERARYPLGPFVIGFVLFRILETELRSGLMSSAGSLMPLVQRPIALTFLTVAVLMLFYPLLLSWRRARIDRAAAQQLD
jgi:putative tricarboxylic transport membrane protein